MAGENRTPKKFDMSRIAELEQELQREKEKLNFIKEMLDCGLWEYEIKRKRLVQSKSLEGAFGGVIDNYRETIKNSNEIYPADIPIFDKFVDSMDAGEPTFSYEMRMDTGTDHYVWVRFEGYTVKGTDGLPEKVVGRSMNIDSEKQADAIMIKRAESDIITGLMTRDSFISRISVAISRSRVTDHHAFILLDINNFASINKQWGNSYGEYVLEAFGNALAGMFKGDEMVARIEGDSFAVFLREIKNAGAVIEIAKSIIEMTNRLVLKRDTPLTLSIGVSVCPEDGKDYSTLYKKASIALQAAKENPSKPCEFYATTLANNPHTVKKNADEEGTTEARKIIREQKMSQYGKVEKYFVDRVMDMLASDEANPDEINKVLAEIGKYYKYTRIYTYNYDKRGSTCFIKYYWNEKAIPYMRVYERVVDAQWDSVYARFKNDALFFCENSSRLDFEVPGELANVFAPVALLQYKIDEEDNAVTCISFERPLGQSWSKEETDFLVNFSKLLCIYMERIRTRDQLKEEIEYSRDVMNNQLVTDYAVMPDSYKLIFVGDANGRQYVAEEDNLVCYKTVMGKNEPCKNCPLPGLRGGNKSRCAMESYFEKNKKWFTSTATTVNHGDTSYDFICWTDVTAFVDRMKSKDLLTGQLTVDRLEQIVEDKISIMRKPQNLFVYFNIPDFNEINDLWGYAICDEVLIIYSKSVQDQLKEEEYLARVSGSTFVMFLDYDDKERIVARLEMIMQGAIAAVHRMYPDVKLRTWVGVYRMNGHGVKIGEMIEYANTARKSINSRTEQNEVEIAFYSDTLKSGATFANFVRSNMHKAFEDKEFRVFFQPRRDDDGEVVKADVVVRWVTKEGQVIERDSFADIMAEDGFIQVIDSYMHEETFRLLAEWIGREIKPPIISLACSWQYMFSPEFMKHTKEVIEKYPIPASLVEFIIPEGVNESNFYRVVSILQELQNMGFVISLDSYMTKYALNNMRTVKMIEENPDLKKLDDIQVEVRGNKPLNADDFATALDNNKK